MALGLKISITCLVFFIVFVSAEDISSTVCDDTCPIQRLVTLKIPLKNGTSKVFWWPTEEEEDLMLKGPEIWDYLPLKKSDRDRWHEIIIRRYFVDDIVMQDYIGQKVGGNFSLSIPSLNYSRQVSCISRECREIDIMASSPNMWAFQCNARPCACPKKDAKGCKKGERLNQGCAELPFSSIGVPLDVPSKVLWRPESKGSYIKLLWGLRRTDGLRIDVENDQLIRWIEIDVQSHFVDLEDGRKVRMCNVSIPALKAFANCSESQNPDIVMHMTPSASSTFSFSCQKKKKIKQGSSAAIAIVVVSVSVIIIGIIVCCIVRKKRKKNRRERAKKRSKVRA